MVLVPYDYCVTFNFILFVYTRLFKLVGAIIDTVYGATFICKCKFRMDFHKLTGWHLPG